MQRWTTVPSPYERRHAEEYVASRPAEWAAGRRHSFAVDDADGRYAGTVDLRPDGAAASVGYGLGPWARGRGLSSRALRLLLEWGFATLGVDVMHWHAVVGNWPSRRVAWAAGFRVDGVVRGLLAERPGADGGPPRRLDGWVGSLRRGEPTAPAHAWHTPPALTDGHAVLRLHRPQDVPRMVEACSDALTLRWLPALPSPYTTVNALAHLEEIQAHHADGVATYWAVGRPDDDTLAGEIGLFGLSPDGVSRSAEIGYWTHPDARGRGLTTSAVRLVVRHALLPLDVGGLGIQRLLLRAAEGNVASRRVALRVGLHECGRDRGVELLRDGTVTDLVRYDAVAPDLAADGVRPAGSTDAASSTDSTRPADSARPADSGTARPAHGDRSAPVGGAARRRHRA
jgi:RimJ/RimL family protein N-acetyltransferase